MAAMNKIRKYFKEEFRLQMLWLNHSRPSDFYLSACQPNKSSVPLLVLRIFILLAAISIVLTSKIIYLQQGTYRFWFIYLTHWGLTMMTLASAFSVVVSARSQFLGPIDNDPDGWLPWYVRVYWVLYNIAVPLAFLITLFYWTVLYNPDSEGLNQSLNVAVHGANSLLMLTLLLTSSQPSRLLHIIHPMAFAVVYFFFGLFYYLAGGVDTHNNPYVYSVVNWTYPGKTIMVCGFTALLLALLFFLKVGIAVVRDTISRMYIKPPPPPEEKLPLKWIANNIMKLFYD